MLDLEKKLSYFLQRDLVFSVDSKILKEGKLILVSVKDYYVQFYLKSGSENKLFELPYPFDIEMMNGYALFYYDIESISHGDVDLYYRLLSLSKKANTKLYNSILMIHEKGALELQEID